MSDPGRLTRACAVAAIAIALASSSLWGQSKSAGGGSGSSAKTSTATQSQLPSIYQPFDPVGTSDITCRPTLKVTANPTKAGELVKQDARKKDSKLRFAPKVALRTDSEGNPSGDGAMISAGLAFHYPGNSELCLVGPVASRIEENGKYRIGPVGLMQVECDQLLPNNNPVARATPFNPPLDSKVQPVIGVPGTQVIGKDGPEYVAAEEEPTLTIVFDRDGNRTFAPIDDIKSKPILGSDGLPLRSIYAAIAPILDRNCQPLNPWVRLLLENAGASASYQHSDQSGLLNAGSTNPGGSAFIDTGDTYSVGFGFVNKPILKSFVEIWQCDQDGRKDVARQGTKIEDFVLNAVTLNTYFNFGRQLDLRDATHIGSRTTGVGYSVSVTYQIDFERAYVHLFHGCLENTDGCLHNYVRPVDPGYYYDASWESPRFWPDAPQYNSDRPD